MKKCKRCGHSWEPRRKNPKACPSCKSYRWNAVKKVLFLLLICGTAHAQIIVPAFVPDTPKKEKLLLQAVYHSEGGEDAQYPFGIRSVGCNGYEECKSVCLRSIKNSLKRWNDAGRQGDFITWFAMRYCPVGAANDPKGLNSNFLKNIRWFLENPKEMR